MIKLQNIRFLTTFWHIAQYSHLSRPHMNKHSSFKKKCHSKHISVILQHSFAYLVTEFGTPISVMFQVCNVQSFFLNVTYNSAHAHEAREALQNKS